jgi:hypothetical protein
MKKIAILMIAMFLGIQFLSAQDQTAQTKDQKSPVSWNETIHDFGKVLLNNPASVTFTMKNTSKAPVIITEARSSCGCTIAEYTKEPVKPNESGIVKATYNAAKVGAFTKSVTVTIEGALNPEVLTIKGEVVEKLPE